jgi:hypothetical protein
MKKLLLLLLATGFSSLSANAQIEYGLRGGLNMSTLQGDIENTDNYLSFHLGLSAAFKVADKLSIQPEIQYSSQGTNYNYFLQEGNYSESIEGELRLQYINLPILAKYTLAKGLFIEAGPQIGYLAYSKQMADNIVKENGETIYHVTASRNLRDLTNNIDYGVAFGLGYEFIEDLFIEVRYYYGLNDVIKDVENNKNSVLQFSIGHKFQ